MKSFQIKIEIEKGQEVLKRLIQFPETVAKEISVQIGQLGAETLGRLKETTYVPVDRGHLKQKLNLTKRNFGFEIRPSSTTNYGLYVHEGTRPHRAPFKAIAGWASRHGLPAFPIWHSIMMKGTKANPFFEKFIGGERSWIERSINDAMDRVLKKTIR